MQGKAYYGEANILDIPYFTAYQPIFNKSGKIIGVLFSGVAKDSITALTDSVTNSIMRSSAMLTITLAVLGFILAKWLISPLTLFAEMVRKANFSDCNCQIPFTERKNELGRIARAFEHFRNSITERTQKLDRLQKETAQSQEREQERFRRLEDATRRSRAVSPPLFRPWLDKWSSSRLRRARYPKPPRPRPSRQPTRPASPKAPRTTPRQCRRPRSN